MAWEGDRPREPQPDSGLPVAGYSRPIIGGGCRSFATLRVASASDSPQTLEGLADARQLGQALLNAAWGRVTPDICPAAREPAWLPLLAPCTPKALCVGGSTARMWARLGRGG